MRMERDRKPTPALRATPPRRVMQINFFDGWGPFFPHPTPSPRGQRALFWPFLAGRMGPEAKGGH